MYAVSFTSAVDGDLVRLWYSFLSSTNYNLTIYATIVTNGANRGAAMEVYEGYELYVRNATPKEREVHRGIVPPASVGFISYAK